ncbi:unnamed protein product [Aureobasidium mustum]|uniref:Uncharacterized protein n=1 Tax=Aureobasidium mustum TaxID=2773714 RepID=A0A9N8KDW1_9PEZI|nr:unnamed protein product [Aureobasidium mustum]
MDDDETRRLILRLQMEDLASIWASSTTSADHDNDLNADVSLRLYRHELRTANQQIDDRISARAAADDELRQRNAIRADRQEARRLFQQLNPDERVPELLETAQLTLTGHTDTCSAPIKDETSSTLGHLQHPDNPTMRASPSLPSRQTIAPTSSVKRSADHLDMIAEPPSKKQATEEMGPVARPLSACWLPSSDRASGKFIDETPVNLDVSAQTPLFPASASTNLKRPAQDDDSVFPPAKRQEVVPKRSPLTFGTIQPTAEKPASSSALSGSLNTFQWGVSPAFNPFGNSSAKAPEAPRFGHSASYGRGFTSNAPSARRQNKRLNRKLGIDRSEGLVSKTVPASKQPVAPGQQSISEPDQSSEVECIACCDEVPRTKAHINSCSHVYCSK